MVALALVDPMRGKLTLLGSQDAIHWCSFISSIFENSDCTGASAGFDDCASCDQATIYANGDYQEARSWRVQDNSC